MVDLLKNKKISKEAFILNNYWLKMRGLLVFSQSLCSYKLMQHSLMTVYFLGKTSICWLMCISSQTTSICLMQLKTQNPLLTTFFCIARVSLLFEIIFRHLGTLFVLIITLLFTYLNRALQYSNIYSERLVDMLRAMLLIEYSIMFFPFFDVFISMFTCQVD